MYRLFQFVLEDGTEKPSIYEHETETEALASFHSKYGSQIKKPYYSAMLLVVLDNTGKVVAKGYHTQSEDYSLSPRLLEVKVTDKETADSPSYETTDLVIGNYHSKLGSAMADSTVKAEMLRGIDGQGNEIIYQYWVRPIEIADDTE